MIFGFNANAANHPSIKTSSAHQETVPFSTEGLKRRRILRSCRTNWKCATSGEHNKRAHKIKVLKNGIPKIAHLYVCHFVIIFLTLSSIHYQEEIFKIRNAISRQPYINYKKLNLNDDNYNKCGTSKNAIRFDQIAIITNKIKFENKDLIY